MFHLLKPLALVIIAILVFTMRAFAQKSNDIVWKVVGVEQMVLDSQLANSAGFYMLHLLSDRNSGNRSFKTHMLPSEVMPLLIYFEVETPNELKGKTFKSQKICAGHINKWDIAEVRDFFLFLKKQGGQYKPPSSEEIHELTAIAFSKMESPDFSDIDNYTVYQSFHKAMEDSSIKKDWLQGLQDRISELSHGQVQIIRDEEASSSDDRGPGDFFVLTKDKKRLKLRITSKYPHIKNPIVFY